MLLALSVLAIRHRKLARTEQHDDGENELADEQQRPSSDVSRWLAIGVVAQPASDIYSLGVIAAEALSGRKLAANTKGEFKMEAALRELIEAAPDEYITLIKLMVAPTPGKRLKDLTRIAAVFRSGRLDDLGVSLLEADSAVALH